MVRFTRTDNKVAWSVVVPDIRQEGKWLEGFQAWLTVRMLILTNKRILLNILCFTSN